MASKTVDKHLTTVRETPWGLSSEAQAALDSLADIIDYQRRTIKQLKKERSKLRVQVRDLTNGAN